MSNISLIIVEGPDKGRCVSISPGLRCVVGRGSASDFRVIDVCMSRAHFRVECDVDWIVSDLSSKNGTSVNGRNVQEAKLSDGDLIVAGDTRIKVSFAPGHSSERELAESLEMDVSTVGRADNRMTVPKISLRYDRHTLVSMRGTCSADTL